MSLIFLSQVSWVKQYGRGAQEVLQGPRAFHSGRGALLELVGLGIPGPFRNSSFKCELRSLMGGCTSRLSQGFHALTAQDPLLPAVCIPDAGLETRQLTLTSCSLPLGDAGGLGNSGSFSNPFSCLLEKPTKDKSCCPLMVALIK